MSGAALKEQKRRSRLE